MKRFAVDPVPTPMMLPSGGILGDTAGCRLSNRNLEFVLGPSCLILKSWAFYLSIRHTLCI